MDTKTKIILGSIGAAAFIGGIAWMASGGAKPAPAKLPGGEGGTGTSDEVPVPLPPAKNFNPDDWDGDLPLPTASDVQGDLTTNWGKTPTEMRPLFLLAEQSSGIRGAGRILALIAKRESGFVMTAHNDSEGEVKASYNAYSSNKDKRPELKYGLAAAGFGSGGLFGLLAPYFLWTGYNEVKGKAPLLAAEPQVMFFPRLAVFAGLVYMQRILANYDVRDIPEIKAGWATPAYLSDPPKGSRGSKGYNETRQRFANDIAALGIDINALPPIEQLRQDAKKAWAGVLPVFAKVVGPTIPTRKVLQA